MMIGELAALGAAVSWTISAILYRKALNHTGPISANIIRLSCTSVILVIFLIAVGKFEVLISLSMPVLVLACVSGIIGLGLGDTLYMMSLERIGVARAIPITCTYPLFSLLWTSFLLGNRVDLPVVLGAVVIVLGIWLLSHEEQNSKGNIQKRIPVKGIVAAFATALLWSVSIAMMDLAVTEAPDLDHALVVNTVRAAAIGVFLLALSPLLDRQRSFLKVKRATIATLIAGGLVALGVGWFFLTYSFVMTSESRAVPISSTTPLFSTLVGAFLLREKVTLKSALGSVAVVAGIFLIFLL